MQATLQAFLKVILRIQDMDIKLIRLMRVKRERQHEQEKVHQLLESTQQQVTDKERHVLELKKEIRLGETQAKEIQERVTKLEAQQAQVKRMDEFNALTKEV